MSGAWLVPVVTIVLTQVAVIATSIYLHRALAHRSLHLRPATDIAFRAALWLTTGQSRQEWVAVHRKHHTFTDREGDPHSPRLLGFWPGERRRWRRSRPTCGPTGSIESCSRTVCWGWWSA